MTPLTGGHCLDNTFPESFDLIISLQSEWK